MVHNCIINEPKKNTGSSQENHAKTDTEENEYFQAKKNQKCTQTK